MRVKNLLHIASLVMFIAIALPASSAIIVPGSPKSNGPAKTEDTRAQQLIQRLEEIKGMDKSELTRLEKKNLRNEEKEIKREVGCGFFFFFVGVFFFCYFVIDPAFIILPKKYAKIH